MPKNNGPALAAPRPLSRRWRWGLPCALLLAGTGWALMYLSAAPPGTGSPPPAENPTAETAAPQFPAAGTAAPQLGKRYRDELMEGRVVWYGPALQEKLGIQLRADVQQLSLALATDDGQLWPLIEDERGRAFRSDPRLREMRVQLRVRRYDLTPALQVLRIYELHDGQRFRIDYWCDVCAITMFEAGQCSCCQQDNELRRRQSTEDSP